MNIKISFISVLLTIILLFPAEASVTGFIGKAHESRGEVEIARQQVDLTRWRLINSARFLGPSASLEYRKTEGETLTDPFHSESFGVKVEQVLFHGGKLVYAYMRERMGHRASQSSYQKVLNDIEYEVADAYYQVLLKRSIAESYDNLLVQMQDEYFVAQQQHAREIMTGLDFEEIVNLRESILVNKKMVEDELAIAGMLLRSAVGADVDMSAAERGFDEAFSPPVLMHDLAECVEIALANRPEMKMAEIIVEQTKYDEKSSKADNLPGLTLEGFAGKSGEAFVQDELILASQWSVFLNLRWAFWGNSLAYRYGESRTVPSEILDVSQRTQSTEQLAQFSLFDNFNQIFTEKEKEVVRLQSQRELEKTRDEVLKEVEQNYRMLLRAAEMVKVSHNRLRTGRKSNEVMNTRRLLGQASLKEVMDAWHNSVQIEHSLYENIYRYYMAAAGLNKSCGTAIIPLERVRFH